MGSWKFPQGSLPLSFRYFFFFLREFLAEFLVSALNELGIDPENTELADIL